MSHIIRKRNLLLALLLIAIPASSFAGIAFSITVAPPVLPVYVQPPCPVAGYLWNPGYWAYGPAGYYWVPGVWVAPPAVGLLWTPGYWEFAGGVYLWHAGFWGPHVGFYGGINYGFGYPGTGFYGGVWSGSTFRYNTAVVNVNRAVVHNVYSDRSFAGHATASRASFNGAGGVNVRPNASERAAMPERHIAGTQTGRQFGGAAGRTQYSRLNTGGRPPQTARTMAQPAARINSPAQHQQTAHAVARTNARPNARPSARMNAPAQHRQTAHAVARPSAPAQRQQTARAMERPSARPSAPAQHQPQMQARRESRGGGHER